MFPYVPVCYLSLFICWSIYLLSLCIVCLTLCVCFPVFPLFSISIYKLCYSEDSCKWKSITWGSCTVITEHPSWHHCLAFHKITKFSSNLKCWVKRASVICAVTNVCSDEISWTCSSGGKMPSLGLHGSIHTSWGGGQDKMGFTQHQFNPAKSCCLTAFQFFMGKGHRKRSI